MKVDDVFIAAAALHLPAAVSTAADAVAAGLLDEGDLPMCPARSVHVADTEAWQLALMACASLLEEARVPACDIDVLAYADMTAGPTEPWSPPHRIARLLGASQAAALGVAQMSNGGAAALHYTICTLMVEHRARLAIAAAGCNFTNLPFPRWTAAPAVAHGDGAAAVLLAREPGPFRIRALATVGDPMLEATFPAHHPFRPAPPRRPAGAGFADNVRAIRSAVSRVVDLALADAGLLADDANIHVVVPTRLGDLFHRQCVQPALPAPLRERVLLLGEETGHLGAGDMLANIAHIHAVGFLPPGRIALFLLTGAGFTASCLIVEKTPEPLR